MSHELWLRQAYEALAARGDHTLANTCRQASVAIETLQRELAVLRGAIEKTLRENGHLADGDNCTLIDLKQALAGQSAPSAAQIDDAISGTRVDVAPQPLCDALPADMIAVEVHPLGESVLLVRFRRPVTTDEMNLFHRVILSARSTQPL